MKLMSIRGVGIAGATKIIGLSDKKTFVFMIAVLDML